MALQQYTALGPKWPGAVSPGRLRTACKEIYDQFVIVDNGLTKINCSEFLGIEKDAINFDDSTFKDGHGAYILAPDRYQHLFQFANYIRLSSRLWHELHGNYNGPELDWKVFAKTNPVDYGATSKGEDLQWWEESDNKQIVKTIRRAIDNCRKGAAKVLLAAPIDAPKVQDDQTQQEPTEHSAVDPGLGTPAVTNPKEVINVDNIQEDQVVNPKKVAKRHITALKQIEVQTPAVQHSLHQKLSLSSISNASSSTSKPSTSTSDHHLIDKTKTGMLKGKERVKPSPSSIITL
ncbi:hypothetical protein JAAARDRAFT_200693 [Jaapia argillacea MUCL 33604]|uniref:Uncharacterized protein n=1 Tax=Jaapia argillacea MUCL 33604 TaxID=933084 RepID=A0A067PF22_9AGAM|nr:hypothetical protein JAAARDRAFT_200693 [Jaapia argillacea MUCL 33604]